MKFCSTGLGHAAEFHGDHFCADYSRRLLLPKTAIVAENGDCPVTMWTGLSTTLCAYVALMQTVGKLVAPVPCGCYNLGLCRHRTVHQQYYLSFNFFSKIFVNFSVLAMRGELNTQFL